MKNFLAVLLVVAGFAVSAHAQVGNFIKASDFAQYTAVCENAVAASSGQICTVRGNGVFVTPSGIQFIPFATNTSLSISASGGTAETVTPSAVSCDGSGPNSTCTFTATYSYAHNAGFTITSGRRGELEAQNAAPGGSLILSQNTVAVTMSGATSTASSVFPDGAIMQAVNVLVTTTITGATSFKIGDGSDDDRWGATIGLTAGTKTGPADYTASGIGQVTSAQNVVLTAVGGAASFSAGVVKVQGTYLLSAFAK